ncbi:hypothetical protein LWF01_02840 [Saxibacter everestensis]|uniref:Uncharacterized protein n=1 Tax=Saxibacter everestensis TaxID=2909229 RepID=A0ABY8QX40_9MICO|nr:hypothetical protein LWF01_02840 [Brevibacteriaceae bacterium ZFBP1038]
MSLDLDSIRRRRKRATENHGAAINRSNAEKSSADVDDLAAEVERLRDENARLRLELDRAYAETRSLFRSSDADGIEAAKTRRIQDLRMANLRLRLEQKDQATAWDEGYHRGVLDQEGELEQADNPYRKDGQ